MKDIESSKQFVRSLRKKAVTLAGVLLVTTACLVYLWIQINATSMQITDLRHDGKSILKSFDALSALSLNLNEAKDMYDHMVIAVPDEFDVVVNAPRRLRDMGKSDNLRVQVDVGTSCGVRVAVTQTADINAQGEGGQGTERCA